jgi:hypothetical protein
MTFCQVHVKFDILSLTVVSFYHKIPTRYFSYTEKKVIKFKSINKTQTRNAQHNDTKPHFIINFSLLSALNFLRSCSNKIKKLIREKPWWCRSEKLNN